MSSPKNVLLVFLASNGGVDGIQSAHDGENQKHGLKNLVNRTAGNLIKKTQFAIPPLALMILASAEVEGIRQQICDLRFEELPLDAPWDLIAISVQTGTASQAFRLARSLRDQGFCTALGGPHVTLFPDSCQPHADVLVCGEADDLWKKVLEDLKTGTLQPRYTASALPDLAIPRPVRAGLFDPSRYFTTNVIQTGRGCPFSCDFCNVHVLNGNRLRQRRIPDIVDEVQRFREQDNSIFFFVDDSIDASPEYAEQLFSQLIPLDIRWFGQATTMLGQKPRLLETFARSGCVALLTGIESIEQQSRSAHRKAQNRATELARNIITIRQSGISLYGSFIYGLDGDTLETPSAILDFIRHTGLDVPGINILRPNPGTRVFERLREEGRLLFDPANLDAWRYTFGQELLYRPKHIDPHDFIDSYCTLTRKIFTPLQSIRRGISAPAAGAAVTLFNLFYTYLYSLSRRDLRLQQKKSL
ncbi:B12-binding domain-containing radical SAM protein [Prosthecochloris sp. N3]|uniref:B12-binding domain-containing radical SAM protein n=1 Tax=Prosthecochloris ethylica TaxID=2743976 RepID=A0ABR9XP66_9CHLB|nr:radical SAM protein [Prosthecochloris ethylica]MBF0585898.1 B12-binding domain-containing radical SAM protein [Prosthecochloris ethylica]MBF0635808.1 B12-binding domain-containing radical SAM protein [Prosthecochloris ethylica]NUK47106.1 B12-binding domain-containing radical SAM protein [Prosthecochloris ethylica]